MPADDQFRVEYFGSHSAQGCCVFSAGQHVQARVILQLREPKKAKNVTVHVSGKAQCHWTESESRTRTSMDGKSETYRETIYFDSKAIYLDHKQMLWSSPDQQIPAGRHEFPFAFTVPAHAPPSFEGSWGHIRYTCTVAIDRPWKFDKKISSLFVVSPFVDLNTVEWALRPVEQHTEKTIGVFLFKHGKLGATVRLPKSGFVPGERVPISVEIDNGTTKEVRRVKAKLVQNTTFVAQRGHTLHYDMSVTTTWGHTSQHFAQRSSSQKVAQLEQPVTNVGPNSKGTFQGHLAIPSCVPNFNTCPLIKVDYSLEVKLETSASLSSTASVKLPLLIGTIPVRQHQQPQPPPQYSVAEPNPSAPTASTGLYPSLYPSAAGATIEPSAPPPDPPSYEESVFGAVKVEGEDYTPRYPFYKDL